MSLISSFITVLRGVPYSFLTFLSSLFITDFNSSSFPSILLHSSILFFKSSHLSFNSTISVLVNLYSCNITIASACSIVKSNFSTKLFLASVLFLLDLITFITSSNIDIAFIRPETILYSFVYAARLNFVLFSITSL